MKSPTFFEGVGVAIGFSLAGGVLYNALQMLFPGIALLRLLIAGIGLAYVLYLLARSPERIGRATAFAAWLLLAAVLWFTHPPLLLYLCIHLLAIWLIRSLYFYSSGLSAVADLGLNVLGLAAGAWALTRTGSVFLGIWCFFLVQALFVMIPASMQKNSARHASESNREDHFQHAYRVAEAAVRKLSSNQ